MSSSGDSDSDSGFEDQGSSDEEVLESVSSDDSDDDNIATKFDIDSSVRTWPTAKANKGTSSLANYALQIDADDGSSDDEDAEGNTIGRVPLHWYDAYDHIGYNISGEKIIRQKGGDRLDNAIAHKDDPSSMHTVYDMYNDRHVVLSERDLQIIRRLQSSAFAHPEHNDTPDYIDYYSSIVEEMPIMAAPEPKRRFVASKWEMMRIVKIAKAIKEGRYVFQKDKERKESENSSAVYMMWKDSEDEILSESSKNRFHLPAPKMPLPGHAESYNPPAEYVLSEEEAAKMKDQDPADRMYDFIPTKHSCLRHVAGYDNFIKERFERCLDLYLCPRTLKRRLNIDPQSLVPRLPKPKELRPFPNMLCLQYIGHTQGVACIALSPDGEYLVSGSEDGTVRLWEVDTSLCRAQWDMGAPVVSVLWNPSGYHHLVAVATGKRVVLISTGTGDRESVDVLDSFLSSAENTQAEENGDESEEKSAKWRAIVSTETDVRQSESNRTGPRVEIQFAYNVKHVAWHQRGDYIAVLVPDAGSCGVSVHQVYSLFTK
jgi:ribosome biogenesis protein ERB1